MATISVRAHWFVIAVLLFELVYRPYLYFGVARYAPYPLLLLMLTGFNGFIYYRLLVQQADHMALACGSLRVGRVPCFGSGGVKRRL